jgi:hypothetical protein
LHFFLCAGGLVKLFGFLLGAFFLAGAPARADSTGSSEAMTVSHKSTEYSIVARARAKLSDLPSNVPKSIIRAWENMQETSPLDLTNVNDATLKPPMKISDAINANPKAAQKLQQVRDEMRALIGTVKKISESERSDAVGLAVINRAKEILADYESNEQVSDLYFNPLEIAHFGGENHYEMGDQRLEIEVGLMKQILSYQPVQVDSLAVELLKPSTGSMFSMPNH